MEIEKEIENEKDPLKEKEKKFKKESHK